MLLPVTVRVLAFVACGWMAGSEALALTLGASSGRIVIGRPVELSVPVALDAGEDAACARAELLHGETAVRAPEVQWVPGAAGQGVLRIRSSLPVREPSVTLHLHAGCRQAATRSFVLLAEVPGRDESAPVVSAVPAAPEATGRGVAQAAAAAPAVPPVPPPAATRSPAARPTPPVAAAAPTRPRTESPAAAQPRLELVALDPPADPDPVLHLTTELRTAPADDAAQREAAAALWLALQKSPDQAMQEALRLENAERELTSLRTASQQNAAAVGQLRVQVERARSERGTAALVVIGLSVLLALILGWLAWQWYRAARIARVGRWFEANAESAQPTLPSVDALAGRSVPAPVVDAAPVRAPVPTRPAASGPASRPGPISGWSHADDYPTSRGGSVRMVGVEELIDVHEQADFFLSIGDTDQAVAVLEAHVNDQVETSALAWMDLLELYHRLGKRAEYEDLRSAFRANFTAHVPEFDDYDRPSESLESYGRALSRIIALWPSRRVLDVIEESIFRKPGLPGAEAFSLQAYRELVLLYHVARDLAPQAQGAQNFSDTSLQPLAGLDLPEPEGTDIVLVPPAAQGLDLDLDLDLGGDAGGKELPALDFDLDDDPATPPPAILKRP